MFFDEPKQKIDVAYTKQELLEKLQELRRPDNELEGTHIYLLTKDVDEFHSIARDQQVSLITTNGVRSIVKTALTNESPIEEKIRRLGLPENKRLEYEKIIEEGGKLLITGTDPFDEEDWTGHTLDDWITNRSNPSNLINKEVMDERPVPFEPEKKYEPLPNTTVAGDFGRSSDAEDPDIIPLKDDQRIVRDPNTKEIGIYQAPHEKQN
ncbi:general stress protein [Solibacillus sp. FSL R5-0449]|uniref:general stress protein n=1 Tax=Solibacillus sp. FSL R5-0449 TaxID=2921639 RepID=UPI0030D4EBAE